MSKERPEGSPKLRVGIITGGFHVPRTRSIMEGIEEYANLDVVFIPAYGPNTAPDNWFRNPTGRQVVFSEIRKQAEFKKIDYRKGYVR